MGKLIERLVSALMLQAGGFEWDVSIRNRSPDIVRIYLVVRDENRNTRSWAFAMSVKDFEMTVGRQGMVDRLVHREVLKARKELGA